MCGVTRTLVRCAERPLGMSDADSHGSGEVAEWSTNSQGANLNNLKRLVDSSWPQWGGAHARA